MGWTYGVMGETQITASRAMDQHDQSTRGFTVCGGPTKCSYVPGAGGILSLSGPHPLYYMQKS